MGHLRRTDASIEKWSWTRDCLLEFRFHFEDGVEVDFIFFAMDCARRGFFAGGRKPSTSESDLVGTGGEGGVEDGEEVGGSGAGSSGGGEDEERMGLLLLL